MTLKSRLALLLTLAGSIIFSSILLRLINRVSIGDNKISIDFFNTIPIMEIKVEDIVSVEPYSIVSLILGGLTFDMIFRAKGFGHMPFYSMVVVTKSTGFYRVVLLSLNDKQLHSLKMLVGHEKYKR